MSFTSRVEFLGHPGVARQLAAGAASANTALTDGIYRISMRLYADIRFAIGQGTEYDASTSILLRWERLDLPLLMEQTLPLFGTHLLMECWNLVS